MNQQPLPNVGVAAEVHATHPTGLVEMGKRPFQSLTPESQQAQAPPAAAVVCVEPLARAFDESVDAQRSAAGRWWPPTLPFALRVAVVCPSPSATV